MLVRWLRVTAPLVLLFGCGDEVPLGPSQALVTHNLSGNVVRVYESTEGALPQGLGVGEPVALTFSYMPRPVDVTCFEAICFYSGFGASSLTVSSRGFTWIVPIGQIKLVNDKGRDMVEVSGVATHDENFPGLLETGFVSFFAEDSEAPFEIVDSMELPETASGFTFSEGHLGIVGSDGSEPGHTWYVMFSLGQPSYSLEVE